FFCPVFWGGAPPVLGGVGEPPPPRLSPGGGNGKGGVNPPCCRRPSLARYARSRPSPGHPRKSLQPLGSRNSLKSNSKARLGMVTVLFIPYLCQISMGLAT